MHNAIRLRLELLHEAAINYERELRWSARLHFQDAIGNPGAESILSLRRLHEREDRARRRIERIEAMYRALEG